MDSETLNGISLSGIINQFINIPHQVYSSLTLSLLFPNLPQDFSSVYFLWIFLAKVSLYHWWYIQFWLSSWCPSFSVSPKTALVLQKNTNWPNVVITGLKLSLYLSLLFMYHFQEQEQQNNPDQTNLVYQISSPAMMQQQQQQYNNISYNIMQQSADVSIDPNQNPLTHNCPIRGVYPNFWPIAGAWAAQASDQNPWAAKVQQLEIQISVRGQGRGGTAR